MNEVFIYQIARVPTAKKGGKYKTTSAEMLATHLLNQIEPSLDDESGEIQLAHSIGMMGNPTRYSLLGSTLSDTITASSVDVQCGGAYKTIQNAFTSIRSEQSSWFIAGGMESSSLQAQRNYHCNDPRFNAEIENISTATFTPGETISLNEAAEKMAIDFGISKEEMIKWTVNSFKNAFRTHQRQLLNKMLHPFNELQQDQSIRDDMSFELLKKLSTSKLVDRTSACSFYDGAGIMLLGDEKFGVKNNMRPIVKIEAVQFIGCHPNDSPQGCILATKKLLNKLSLDISDIDIYEVCESYSVKPLAFSKHFGVPKDRINILGSNLAMGHPFAASGILNSINLVAAMEQKNARTGLVCAGIAGGLGAAMLISK